MIDRLIAGAGAISAALDRFVRTVTPGRALADGPASLLVAGGLAVLAALLVAVAAESLGTASLRTLDPAVVAADDDLGARVHATVSGRVPSTYVETYEDRDADGIQDPDEVGAAWDYVLLGQGVDAGLIVRSTRPPWEIYRYAASGVVVEDREYVGADLEYLGTDMSIAGLEIDPTRYLDATGSASGAPHDLATDLPAAGTAVRVEGARLIEYLTFCSTDPDGDGECSDAEVDGYDVVVYEPTTGRAIVVATDESPEFVPGTFTGILRRDAAAIAQSVAAPGDAFDSMGITVSPVYLLDEGASPADPTLLVALALAAIVGAGIIGIGVAGGYVIFRRGGAVPVPAASFAPGERVATRVTGVLRGPLGTVHVREVAADVVRYVPPPPAPPVSDAPEASPDRVGAAEEAPAADVGGDPGPPPPPPTAEPETTPIVERRDRAHGVALGRGELTSITTGTVVTFHGSRPGVRLRAGTGRLILSFDDVAARDRVAAELAAELTDVPPSVVPKEA